MEEPSIEELVDAGLGHEEARSFHWKLNQSLRASGESPSSIWRSLSKNVLAPSHPFRLHQLLYHSCYKNWDSARLGPPPVWIPSLAQAKSTNLGRTMDTYGRDLFGCSFFDPITNFAEFQRFSVENPDVYWRIVLQELEIPFVEQPSRILDMERNEIDGEPCPGGQWLCEATLNAAECCFQESRCRKAFNTAILWRDEGNDTGLNSLTLSELRSQSCRVANSLERLGFSSGDAVAINMPMTPVSVVVYLGIVLCGCVVVSIADSFSSSEIETRLNISKAKAIFTQDVIVRGGKDLALYTRVVDANAPRAFVIPGKAGALTVELRSNDMSWDEFLAVSTGLARPQEYKGVAQSGEAFSNILFSSGTTGDPKAIPWTHLTPIKAAADGWAHQDIRSRDVVSWPTNLGWMMGPWLVYATLVNGATIALYNGSPLGRGFAKFVQDAKVTMLGVVPSIVRHWKTTKCLDDIDLSHIRREHPSDLCSTGEASTVDDYLWLMSKASYKPVIEYCGGTEIGGGFVTGSLLQPQALASFSTPAMGCDVFILDEAGIPLPSEMPGIGECALDSSMLGASRILLNANHFNIYFKGMPKHNGKTLRRHGDEFERTPGGFYKAHGRVDDTMNLGGIKVSSVEIERICNAADQRVLETAAIGVSPTGGGPEKLCVIAVLKAEVTDKTDISSELKLRFNAAIQRKLNPLFKAIEIAGSLPRTASNKVMRRTLRSQSTKRTSLL
ncbi:hypothetical protein SELMODRAFT_109501 [Selaginella moellendorffii]|uniref:AMP-dependent synthetase/ligase domain-containing protein n=1 Tax=Selaginella moellendorffii TaxID=88036 RepID=D8S5Q6_SELML|nr:hypothetical protein SELMODRAFT_109501 [Selaginella moellendorffii]